MGLMRDAPFLSTVFAPSEAPMSCPQIMTLPAIQLIFPKEMKKSRDATLLVKLSTFA